MNRRSILIFLLVLARAAVAAAADPPALDLRPGKSPSEKMAATVSPRLPTRPHSHQFATPIGCWLFATRTAPFPGRWPMIMRSGGR